MSKHLKTIMVSFVCVLGILIVGVGNALLSSQPLEELPMPMQSMVISLLENPIDRPFALGFQLTDMGSEGYRVKVITLFGLHYADIYINPDGKDAYIERHLLF